MMQFSAKRALRDGDVALAFMTSKSPSFLCPGPCSWKVELETEIVADLDPEWAATWLASPRVARHHVFLKWLASPSPRISWNTKSP